MRAPVAAACTSRSPGTGVYALDYTAIAAAQPGLADCPSAKLALLNRGNEVPIRIVGAGDGRFGARHSHRVGRAAAAWPGELVRPLLERQRLPAGRTAGHACAHARSRRRQGDDAGGAATQRPFRAGEPDAPAQQPRDESRRRAGRLAVGQAHAGRFAAVHLGFRPARSRAAARAFHGTADAEFSRRLEHPADEGTGQARRSHRRDLDQRQGAGAPQLGRTQPGRPHDRRAAGAAQGKRQQARAARAAARPAERRISSSMS